MLATTFLALGLATSAAAALDLLLGDAQKQYIADTTVRLWNWLDDAKRLSFLRWLKQRRFQIAYAVAVNVVITAAVGIYVWKETYLPQAPSIMDGWVVVIASLALVIFLFSLVGIIGIIKTMQADSANRILLRAAGFTSVSLLPPIVSWLWLSNITVKGYPDWDFFLAMFLLVALSTVSFIVMSIIVVPLFAVYFLSCGLTVTEYIVRRIAESNKGPILALSVILATIGGLGKFFGY